MGTETSNGRRKQGSVERNPCGVAGSSGGKCSIYCIVYND